MFQSTSIELGVSACCRNRLGLALALTIGLGALVQAKDPEDRRTSSSKSGTATHSTSDSQDLRSVIAGGPSGAVIELVPVPARVGMYPMNTIIAGNEIILNPQPTPTRIWLEFKVSGWDPNGNDILEGTGLCVAGVCTQGRFGMACTANADCDQPGLAIVQAFIVGAGLFDADVDLDGDVSDDGNQSDILPAMVSCPSVNSAGDSFCETALGELGTLCEASSNVPGCPFDRCCKPLMFKGTNPRPDCLTLGVAANGHASVSAPNYDWGVLAGASFEIIHDDGIKKWFGTLVIDVPADALGRYTIAFDTQGSTFLGDRQSPPALIPAELRSASIRVRGCMTNVDCNDNDACTQDICNPILGVCSFSLVPAFDPVTECCDATNGGIMNRFDSNPSTCDSCSLPDSRGIPVHTVCDDGDACTANQCNSSQVCQYPLVAGFDLLMECCDPVSGLIASRDDSDDCTDDLCSLPNSRGVPVHPILPDTTPCDDSLACTLDDHCDGVQSQDAGGCITGTDISTLACSDSTDCEIATGTAFPCVAGFCDCMEVDRVVWDSDVLSPRRATRSLYFHVEPAPGSPVGTRTALEVRMLDLENPTPANDPCCLSLDYSTFETGTCTASGEGLGCARWVGPVRTYAEDVANLSKGIFKAARLQCTPYFHDWTQDGPFGVYGAEIIPSSTYDVVAYSELCEGDESNCNHLGSPVRVLTRRAGDVWLPFRPPVTFRQPDGIDQVVIVDKFLGKLSSPPKLVAVLQPNVPQLDTNISALDIVSIVDHLRGFRYPFSGPCPCPSTVVCGAPCMMDTHCPGPGGFGMCVRTCTGGPNDGMPCFTDFSCRQCSDGPFAGAPCQTNADCQGGVCPAVGSCSAMGLCRDRCGRCSP